MVKRQLTLDRDLPVFRRYASVFIETSTPTIALALHIDNMGSVQALGYVVPLSYFIFIILSTLRLDFWLSTFTGFVAAAELLGMALFYHPDGPPDVDYHVIRSLIVFICGVLAGAVGVQLRRQFEKSIAAASARDRVTNLFGQHVSPQVVERLLAEGTSTASDTRRVAVMFVDFRSFTAASRSRTPQEVVDRLDGAPDLSVPFTATNMPPRCSPQRRWLVAQCIRTRCATEARPARHRHRRKRSRSTRQPTRRV